MHGRGPSALFAGDLGDPWVAGIAAALPAGASRLHCASELPDNWPPSALEASAFVLHRPIPTLPDLDRLRRFLDRFAEPHPPVILCVGPHARYHHLERWAPHVAAILPEATASEIVARYIRPLDAPARLRPPEPVPIAIVSTNFEFRLTLADACQRSGYAPQPVRDWPDTPPSGLAVWDLPVLDPTWPETLTRVTCKRRVVLLTGFADRSLVTLARDSGASSCLDVPCNPDDLIFVLDRLSTRRASSPDSSFDSAHPFPPAPVVLTRRLASRVVGRSGEPYNP